MSLSISRCNNTPPSLCMSATSVSSIHLRDPIFQRSSIATPIHPVCQTIRRPTAGATPSHPHQHLRFLFQIFRFTSPPIALCLSWDSRSRARDPLRNVHFLLLPAEEEVASSFIAFSAPSSPGTQTIVLLLLLFALLDLSITCLYNPPQRSVFLLEREEKKKGRTKEVRGLVRFRLIFFLVLYSVCRGRRRRDGREWKGITLCLLIRTTVSKSN